MTATPSDMSSSLSSVVSNLVRAQMGASVPNTVTDDDLDRHVADLLIKDAKKRAERYSQTGIRAYLASQLSDSNAPKANKRFLSSIIRSTDEHNKTILRAQAQSAQEIQREKEEALRKQRRARAEEAVAAERLRRSGGSERGRRRRTSPVSDGWDHWDGRTGDRKRKKREWETWDGMDSEDEDHRRSHRSSSRRRHKDDELSSTKRKSRRSRSREDDSRRSHRSHHRRTHRSRSRSESPDGRSHRHSRRHRRKREPSPSSSQSHKENTRGRSLSPDDSEVRKKKRSSRHISPSLDNADSAQDRESKEAELRAKLKAHKTKDVPKPATAPPLKRQRTRSPSAVSTLSSRMSISPSPSPGPEPASQLPSKMDKYFEESYDPRLDVAPLTMPTVPATGLINNAEFEGWDAMLDLLRARKEDKLEKKRLERMGLSKDQIKKEMSSAGAVADRWESGGTSVMDIKYKKRGSTREWDLGKEVT